MALLQHNPPHPGAFINEVYIQTFNLVPNQVAAHLKVNPSTFSRLLNGKSDVSPEMAVKLSIVFRRSPESWLLMQDNFNLNKVRNELDTADIEPLQFAC